MSGWRDMVPATMCLPAQHAEATIDVGMSIKPDGTVYVPGLDGLLVALPPKAGDAVRWYCQAWTDWLARVERAVKP